MVDALVGSVRAAYPRLSHRYYRLKAGWFKKKKLAHWDRNAPLPFAATGSIAWPEARNMVLTAYRGFSPEMADIAERFFTDRWIDAPVRPGKAPGAFSHPTTPSAHPYVLMNYQGKPRDVMTLAHELGHGVHQVLAAKNGALMAPTPLTLAETASVFGEMLTFKRLLAQTSSAKQRQALLAGKVEDMINTVVRQIAFYSFERAVHTERRNGELTAERIGEIWLSVQGESLGPAIDIRPGYENFWMYIPHFIHSPFYVYAYAFGDCLVNSLYAVYENAAGRLCRTLSGDARGRRHQALFRTAQAVRARRQGPEILGRRAVGDLGHDRRAGGDGLTGDSRKTSVERGGVPCYTICITELYAMNEVPRKTAEGEFIQIKKIGNSLGLILSKDMLSRLKLKEGDKLHIVEQTERGIKLSPYDPKHAKAMEIARRSFSTYADTYKASQNERADLAGRGDPDRSPRRAACAVRRTRRHS